MKYSEKNMHALENKEYLYWCEYMGCKAEFQTTFIVESKMVQRYKIFFRKIVQKKNIDVNKNEILFKLKKNYEEIKSKLIDQELFSDYLG